MSIRNIIVGLIALSFWPAVAVHSMEKVVLGYSGVGSGEEVNHFAKESGVFKKHGLDVEIVYIPGGSTVVQAMISGGVQFGRGLCNRGGKLAFSRLSTEDFGSPYQQVCL
jgi:NitT/TauT family transport system substrate-binding protein